MEIHRARGSRSQVTWATVSGAVALRITAVRAGSAAMAAAGITVVAVVGALVIANLDRVEVSEPGSSSATAPAATVGEINAAIAAEPTALPALRTRTAIGPAVGSDPFDLGGDVRLQLPATGARRTVAGTSVYSVPGTDAAQLAVQQVALGTRALINVDGPSAPQRYEFVLSGNVAGLRRNDDGSAAAYDSAGTLVGGFAAPWARDAAGQPVPTRYEVRGRTLIQIIEHRSPTVQYGVTADPLWLALAIRACAKVRCYRWMPGYVRRQYLHGHINPAVVRWLRGWFCAKTGLC